MKQIQRRSLRPLMTSLSASGAPAKRGALVRVAFDVRGERRLVRVLALADEGELARAVVEGRAGKSDRRLDHPGDVRARVGVARVRDRVFAQEGLRRRARVVRVDPDEGDALAELRREVLEPRELDPAGPAPRGPLVDDHGVTLQVGEPMLEGARAAGQELVGLAIERGERLRRPRQRALVVGRLARVAAAGAASAGREADEEQPDHRGGKRCSRACDPSHPAHENASSPHQVQCDALIRVRSNLDLDRGGIASSARGETTCEPGAPPASLQRAQPSFVGARALRELLMAKSIEVAAGAAKPIQGDQLERVREFTRESILLEGETIQDIAPGSARYLAMEAALAELDAGRETPTPEW